MIIKPLKRFRKTLGQLRSSKSGLALIEFAYSLPIFMGLGLYGTEIAFLAVTQMNVSQSALTLADNASRMGQTVTGSNGRVVFETDIGSVFAGVRLQGERFNLLQNGRVILSSLETNTNGRFQRIRWQRCIGLLQVQSDYGVQGTFERNTPSFIGMGPAGNEIRAERGSAVMYVEIFYDYNGLFGDTFVSGRRLKQEAAFSIRDDRVTNQAITRDGSFVYSCGNRFTDV